MTDALSPYVVADGDHLLDIALRSGVEPNDIWNHPKNAAVAKSRDPDMLAPGDVLYVPAPPKPTLRLSHGGPNRYAATVPTVTVRLMFMGATTPIANEPCEIDGVGDPIQSTTDPTGLLTFDVPVNIKSVKVSFPKRFVEYDVRVGGLGPKETPAGLKARLAHLGYGSTGAESDALESVLKSFQSANGLPVSGKPDDATLKALQAMHGR